MISMDSYVMYVFTRVQQNILAVDFNVKLPNVEPSASILPTGSITAYGQASVSNFNPFNTDINTIRGQETGYPTLNPLFQQSNVTLSNGNLV